MVDLDAAAAEGRLDTDASPAVQVVTPWDVQAAGSGGIDYDKLLTTFGCQPIDAALIARVERVTGVRAHVLLRRGMFFAHRCALRCCFVCGFLTCHRDLTQLLDAYEKDPSSFYLYTGRVRDGVSVARSDPKYEARRDRHLRPFTSGTSFRFISQSGCKTRSKFRSSSS